MRKLLLLLAFLLAPSAAFSQARVIGSTCGDMSGVGGNYAAGGMANMTQTTAGQLCTNAAGGGGGGGAVTMAPGAVSSGAYLAGALVDGANATLGTTTQAACSAYNTSGCTQMQLERLIAQLLGNPLQINFKNLAGLSNTPQQIGTSSTGGDMLVGIICSNANSGPNTGGVEFVQFFDSSTTPTPGATAKGFAPIPGNGGTGGFGLGIAAITTTTKLWAAADSSNSANTAPVTALDCSAMYYGP